MDSFRFTRETDFTLDKMDTAAERVNDVVTLYKEAETPDFITKSRS